MTRKAPTRILILCSLDKSLISFRGDMMNTLIENGYRVFAAAPDLDQSTAHELTNMGVVPIAYKLQRTGLNPWKDLLSILSIKNIITENNIEIIFPYTIKPVIYGSLAARITQTPVISLITGLGFTFSKGSKNARILQKISEFLYRIALRKNRTVIFQNEDDLALFRDKKIISPSQNTTIVDGSGIHLERYPFRRNNNSSQKIKFIFVARLIREKGTELFMNSAKILKAEFPQAEFHIIGNPDTSPSSISIKELEQLHHQNIIHYHGFQKDVLSLLSEADVFVLPTYYREGIPRSILEALSIGLPIITTDTPGCKETVYRGLNGILIKPLHLDSLTTAMRYFLENSGKIEDMGIESRKLAERRFNVDLINHNILKIINQGLS
ncbi:N,N'-diacetylbacillosaminyl-diphospho-undecaprenol alpha-1,3-N-acetylgalactosaminyltransferase [Arenibacter antarcticus]|uniref:Glycosyltransferase family 4 protein n=1 Tax=Arenibacter antarcticus TaxID=2040469 RepID=A0ABW5VHY4_9FLAO|nr:glycosyltransferase family 4 protein [Arenibacter sp. H213]MCM4167329.1 glycosyltransferase family 1 protein [Arenibacter sp. H213]